MKSSKNKRIGQKEFSELLDLLMQSTLVSGQDKIVKDMYQCEQFYDKTSDEAKTDTLNELYRIALTNSNVFGRTKAENNVWKGILRILNS
jgi:hypothetical protein